MQEFNDLSTPALEVHDNLSWLLELTQNAAERSNLRILHIFIIEKSATPIITVLLKKQLIHRF